MVLVITVCLHVSIIVPFVAQPPYPVGNRHQALGLALMMEAYYNEHFQVARTECPVLPGTLCAGR